MAFVEHAITITLHARLFYLDGYVALKTYYCLPS
jgi:hypothetical protein